MLTLVHKSKEYRVKQCHKKLRQKAVGNADDENKKKKKDCKWLIPITQATHTRVLMEKKHIIIII